MDPSVPTPAPPNTTSTSSPSQTTRTPLLPIVTEAASGYPSPATYRLRRILIGLQVISVSILSVIGFVTFLGLSLALFAFMGAIILLTGNGIFGGATKHASQAAASIGAVGSLILSSPLCLLYLLFPPPGVESRHLVSIAIGFLFFPPISGLIGSAVLLHHHIDLGGIDISHGIWVGLAGGFSLLVLGGITVVWLSVFFNFSLIPLLVSVLSFILSPIWLAMMGVQWVKEKWTKDWTDRSHLYSGSRGDDPEIIAQLQNLPGRD